jgi:polyisoprenyl-teichoic acid--peptidoglycan teichoic acid transferase
MEPRRYTGKAPIRHAGHPWYFYVIYFFVLLFLITSAWLLYIVKTNIGNGVRPRDFFTRSQIAGMDSFNVIIAGLDGGEGKASSHRTDSLIVAHINQREHSAILVSIPRDSRVPIPGHGVDKINAAFALGGPDLMRKTVEDFLGVPVPFYFVMYVDGFVKVIDSLGGVEVNVEKKMNYDDRSQNLHIHLKPGLQLLNGTDAMGYARFRHDATGDFGRIGRQQKVLDSLQRKALSTNILSAMPTILDTLLRKQLLVTNLSIKDALQMRSFYNEEVRSNTHMFMLPGTPKTIHGVSYVLPDLDEVPFVVGAVFQDGFHPENKLIKIEVKNGCGYRGVAEAYARRLAYYGFNVLGTSNADSFDYQKTVVVSHKPSPFDRAVARILNADVTERLNPESVANMDVIVGRDKLERRNSRNGEE